MKKVIVVIVMLGLMGWTAGDVWGQFDFDYTKVTRLRWMEPDREPISYEEYLSGREFASRFDARLVQSGNKTGTPICIVINNLLYLAIQGSFSVFLSDLESDGYSVNVYTALNNGDEVALKSLLISEWNDRDIAGVIFMGDLPVAWYEMNVWGQEEFPIADLLSTNAPQKNKTQRL